MKLSLVLGALGMAFVAMPALAQDLPDVFITVDPVPVVLACSPPVIPVPAPTPVGFGDVHEAIAAMRAMIAEPGGLAQPAVVTSVDAFVQHLDLVIADRIVQQEASMTAMIDGMMGQNGEAIDAFLTAQPMDPGPSLFLDHEFQVAVAPFAQVGGFFAP